MTQSTEKKPASNNAKNLIPQAHKLSVEEASRGGKASGVARAKKRALREIIETIGQMDVKDPEILEKLHKAGFTGPITQDDLAVFGVIERAQSGDPSALKLMAELRGEYSTRLEVEPVQPKPLIDLTEGGKK